MYLNRFARINFWGNTCDVLRSKTQRVPVIRSRFYVMTPASRTRLVNIYLDMIDAEQMVRAEIDLGESKS